MSRVEPPTTSSGGGDAEEDEENRDWYATRCAIRAATRALFLTSAMLDSRALLCVASPMRLRMKGVTAWPRTFWSSAACTASLMAWEMSGGQASDY
jgi:hypothetical protein